MITFNTMTLLPSLVPMVGALLVLIVDVVIPRQPRLPWLVAVLTLLAAVGALVLNAGSNGSRNRTLCNAENCFYEAGHVSLGMQGLALVSALVVTALFALRRPSSIHGEQDFPAIRAMLLLSATAGAVGVIAARDIVSWLVTIELATIPSIALVVLQGGRRAAQGGLTLLVTALASFAVQVLGVAMWFAATGTASLSGNAVLHAYAIPSHRRLLIVGIVLILVGVGFKLSLAPFHAWTPEAFAGSGAQVSAFLATTSKVGAAGGMLVVIHAAAPLAKSMFVPLAISAALSMTVGNLMALCSNGALRFMAWSSVAQAGWIVLPMTAGASGAQHAAASYLGLYIVGTLAVFVVLATFEDGLGPAQIRLDDVRGLFRSRPLFAGTMGLGLLALAGLPPAIVGVIAKIVALSPPVRGGAWWLVVIAILNAVFGIAVYLRPVALMFSSDDESPAPHTARTKGYGVLVGLVALALIVTSVAPRLLLAAF